jgi:hypothetical protein
MVCVNIEVVMLLVGGSSGLVEVFRERNVLIGGKGSSNNDSLLLRETDGEGEKLRP